VIVARAYHTSGVVVSEIDGSNTTPAPAPAPVKTGPTTRTVLAVDGLDLAHVWGLVDVCSDDLCNLQLSSVSSATETASTQRLGLLRTQPTDGLVDPRIVVVNSDTVVISGLVSSGSRQYQTIRLTNTGTGTPAASATVRPIQTTVEGAIRVVHGSVADPVTLPHQPQVSLPVLQTDAAGWWVSGTSPSNGELAVSVSRDDGTSWSTHTLGLLPDSNDAGATVSGPALATSNGVDVYVLVAASDRMVLIRSVNGGTTWSPVAAGQSWPSGSKYGMVAEHDGSLLVWFTNGGITTYMRSVDSGETFQPDTGPPAPGGAIVQVSDGYVSVGTQPALSHDGQTWVAAYVPYVSLAY
jgi:hypothetical protein